MPPLPEAMNRCRHGGAQGIVRRDKLEVHPKSRPIFLRPSLVVSLPVCPTADTLVFAQDRSILVGLQRNTSRSSAMIIRRIKSFLRPLAKSLRKDPDRFLKEVSGVVHVGANLGQERQVYSGYGLSVIWIEPIPDIFDKLKANISGFTNQRAIQALVTDVDDKEYCFHIANNDGQSSSILELKQHKEIWPSVDYSSTMHLKSTTLATLFRHQNVDASLYQALIMDTQGSELLVLQGSLPILKHFKFIKIEVPNFESYEGCCQLDDIKKFMSEHGYAEYSRRNFASKTKVGSYFDIVYKRKS